MGFIARSGFVILFALVVFALLELRYDTLRSRDEGSVSVIPQSTAFFPV